MRPGGGEENASALSSPFTASIGEHSAVLRERICGALGCLRVRVEDAANRADAATISDSSSRVRVAAEPTNEEWIMASHALNFIRGA